jgi:hypothetical protein
MVYIEQVNMFGWQLVVKESESAMTRKRLNRLWARPFDSSSSCIPSRSAEQKEAKREEVKGSGW